MDFLRKFLEKSYHGIQELDGEMAVNLGFFLMLKSLKYYTECLTKMMKLNIEL